MEYKECCEKIYPTLEASAPVGEIHIVETSALSYRLQKITEIQKELQNEKDNL